MKTKDMTLKQLLEDKEILNKKSLSINQIKQEIQILMENKKSVFTFHMEDGRKIISSDSNSTKEEMMDFFKAHPQRGCIRVEFHK